MPRTLCSLAISLDGFAAGPHQGPDDPLGEGGERLHEWMFESAGPVHPVDRAVAEEHAAGVGAHVMGRQMFGGGPGPWDHEVPWRGWWGEDPPFHAPVFVVTHHPRDPVTMAGGTTFHFVTEGPQAALARAREVAGALDVRVGGGASVANQLLALGEVDVLLLHHVPILLGAGERLFAGLGPGALAPRITEVLASPRVTHVRYALR